MFSLLSQLRQKKAKEKIIFERSYPRAFVEVICGRNMDLGTFKKISEKATEKGGVGR